MRRMTILCMALLAGSVGGCTTLRSSANTPRTETDGCVQPPFVFATPTNLGSAVNSQYAEGSPCISSDGLCLYFDSLRPGGFGGWDIWVAKRKTVDSPWETPKPLEAPINTRAGESGPCLSADNLTLYFASSRPGGLGNFDIWVTTRQGVNAPWSEPLNLGPAINSPAYDNHPSVSADGLSLFFDSCRLPLGKRQCNQDLYIAHRDSPMAPWQNCENAGPEINKSIREYSPELLPDGRTLFFDSFTTDRDLWMATRRSATDDWDSITRLKPLMNTPYIDTDPSLWSNGGVIYFASTRPGGLGSFDIWQAVVTSGDGAGD